jgi:simple sugar transport system permease protein
MIAAPGRLHARMGRESILASASSAVPVAAFLLSLLVGAILIAVAGVDPLRAYRTVFEGAFGSLFNFSVTIRFMIPLVLTGLAVAVPLRCGLFNIGAEGQLLVGAVAAAGTALFAPRLPLALHVTLALLAAAAAGSAWAALAGLMKALRGASEIITTIMLNFVALYLLQYLTLGPWKDPAAFYSVTKQFPASASLPSLGARTAFDAGIFVAAAALAICAVLLRASRFGFSLRVVGEGPRAAQHVGVPIGRTMVLAMAIGGAFAGWAGATEVLGVQHNLSAQFSPGYGFEAVGVALLGRGKVSGVLVAAFFFAALKSGTALMERVEGVPSSVALVLTALPVIFVAVAVTGRAFFRAGAR